MFLVDGDDESFFWVMSCSGCGGWGLNLDGYGLDF